jgi:hypothetical protein
MELSERMRVDRYELGSAREDSALRVNGRAAVAVTTVLLSAIGALLTVGAVETFDGWAHAIVIGAILFTVVGLAIAISPNRRG